MNSSKVKCTCGHSWDKSDSSKKDLYICHECGRNNSNNMKNGGWLDGYDKAQEGEVLYTPPKSHYKRLYGHAKDYSQGENEKMRIDPNTGYSYFPQETSLSQEKEVPDSPWNVSRFLFDPIVINASQGIHNAIYDKEGKIIDIPEKDAIEEGRLTDGLSRRERYNAAKKDITSYYKEDLKQNDSDVEKKVDDTMDLVRKMRRTEEMMQKHNAHYKDLQNPEEVFRSAVGFNELLPINSIVGDFKFNPRQAKKAYKMFQKTWRGTSGKEARQNSREELRKAKELYKVAKEQMKQGLPKSKPSSNPDPETQFWIDNYTDTPATNESIQYYNTDPKRGEVETSGNKKGVRYVPISNSVELKKWKEQGNLKNGGWLDNYNDSKTTAPEGMVGDGYSNVGRNYSPAWGGQFQNGGITLNAQMLPNNGSAPPPEISNAGQELIDIGVRASGKKLPFGLGSAIGTTQSLTKGEMPTISDTVGLLPIPEAQLMSLVLLYGEKEKEMMREFNVKKNRGKKLSELSPKKETRETSVDETNVKKPNIPNVVTTSKKKVEKQPTPVVVNKKQPAPVVKKVNPKLKLLDLPEPAGPVTFPLQLPKAQTGMGNIFGNMMGGRNTSQYEMYGDGQAGGLNTFNPHYTRPAKSQPLVPGEAIASRPYSNYRPVTDTPYSRYPQAISIRDRQFLGEMPMRGETQMPMPGPSWIDTPRYRDEYDVETRHTDWPSESRFSTNPLDLPNPAGPKTFTQTPSAELPRLRQSETKDGKQSWNIQQKNTRMRGKGGSYDDMNVNTTDPEQVKRALQKAEQYNNYIQKQYGNSKNPKAIDRLNTLRNDVEITPQYQVGGSIPGAVGFTYARTKGIPSNGPYAKKTLASAQNGTEMSYYQHGLDWKPKGMENGGWLDSFAEGGIIKDDMGQWAHPGEITEIGSNNITMQGVPYDVLGISDTGDTKLMKPGKNYKFKGKKVTEFPMAKNGVNQQDQKTFEQLDQLTNFTNYNKPQPGGWLEAYK